MQVWGATERGCGKASRPYQVARQILESTRPGNSSESSEQAADRQVTVELRPMNANALADELQVRPSFAVASRSRRGAPAAPPLLRRRPLAPQPPKPRRILRLFPQTIAPPSMLSLEKPAFVARPHTRRERIHQRLRFENIDRIRITVGRRLSPG